MSKYKRLLGSSLSLRDYDPQVGEAYAAIRALNKLTTQACLKRPELINLKPAMALFGGISIYVTKLTTNANSVSSSRKFV